MALGAVVQYLGRYTHRVAISNSRIVAIAGEVTFRWKDYRKGLQNQLLTLDAEEFIGRFMRHVLSSGYYKIRYYGLLDLLSKENVKKRGIYNPIFVKDLIESDKRGAKDNANQIYQLLTIELLVSRVC